MIKNKIILTSLVSLCFAMPAFAEFTAGQQIADENGLLNGMACDEDTLGVTQDTANLEAIWTPNTYSISYTCANGMEAMLKTLMPGVNCNTDHTNDECINEKYAIYGKSFTFAGAACGEIGYHQTGWSCTRDTIANDTPTIYSPGQQLTWDIPYNLTCTEVRVGNTITLDWYNMGQKQTVSAAASECTYGEANSLTLPSNPSARPGYTFGGWRVFDVCSTLNTQGTCNMNAQCFWNGTQADGTCVNIDSADENCDNQTGENTCASYCPYNELTQSCYLDVCGKFQTAEQCSAHGNSNCSWDPEQQTCGNPQAVIGFLG